MNNDKKQVITGVIWKFSERFLAQFVSIIVAIILARILTPNEYGVVSLVIVFVNFFSIFVTNGLGLSLIQKKEADEVDFSTVFYFNIGLSLVLYAILFFASPVIANFYEMPILKPVLRVLAILIPINSINSIQQAHVSRQMIFKKFFWATIIGTLISAAIGIVMAYKGYGVWALVAQQVSNCAINTIVLQFTIHWKPVLAFSFKKLKSLFDYGWKLLVQGVFLNIYSTVRNMVIGKKYDPDQLAYYTKGNQYTDLIATNIDNALNMVVFAAMAKKQSDLNDVKNMTRRTIGISSYVMNPMFAGFFAVASSFIICLLTEKWVMAVPFLQISCVVMMFRSIQTAILQAIKAIGKSNVYLAIDVPIRLGSLAMLFITIPMGVKAVAISEIIITVVGSIIYYFAARKYIGYKLGEIARDYLPNFIISVLMGAAVYLIGMVLPFGHFVKMCIQIFAGILIYLALSVVTKNKDFGYLLQGAKEIINRKKSANNSEKIVENAEKTENLAENSNLTNSVEDFVLANKNNCCGCSACMSVCPVKAISMQTDEEGFVYPVVDKEKCIKCGKCKNSCKFNGSTDDSHEDFEVYAAKTKDRKVLEKSSSGGMFTVLSDAVLNKGGAVASPIYNYKENRLDFELYEDKKSRDKARGSKYIQATANGIYEKCIEYAKENKKKTILFCGTGCQVSQMKKLAETSKLEERFVFVDLICHGASSPKVWKEFVELNQEKLKGKNTYLTFKDKRVGWESPLAYMKINDKEVPVSGCSDWFYESLTVRPACYNCKYAKPQRDTDITIGDFWGVREKHPDLYDEKGVSIVLIQSKKGKEFFDKVLDNIDYQKIEDDSYLQPRLCSAPPIPEKRDKFWKTYSKKGVKGCLKKFKENKLLTFLTKAKNKIKRGIKKVLIKLKIKKEK